MIQNFRMIDVGEKNVSRRRAVATGSIKMSPATIEMIRRGDSPKGNILALAEVAGIMAAKNTPQILPLCHPLSLDSVRFWFEVEDDKVTAHSEVTCHGKTGVEMEALVGLNACLLSIYDLAKAVDPVIEISDVYLETKEGGKSGIWQHPKTKHQASRSPEPQPVNLSGLRFAVATLSDRASQGIYKDESGPLLVEYFSSRAATQVLYKVIPDEEATLRSLVRMAGAERVDVLLLTGGTGLSRRDITPEVIRELSCKELIGFGELQRLHGSQYTKAAWLSRASAFVVDQMLVVLFPGSPKAVRQGIECLGDLIPHAIRMIRGESHHA